MLEILVFSAYQSLTTISGRFSSISSFQYPSFFRVISWDLKHGLQQKQKHSKQLHRTHLSTSVFSLPAWLTECSPRPWVPTRLTGLRCAFIQTQSRHKLLSFTPDNRNPTDWIKKGSYAFLTDIDYGKAVHLPLLTAFNASCLHDKHLLLPEVKGETLSGEHIWFARPQLLPTTFGRRTEKFSTRCDSLIPSATHHSL